MPVLVQALSRRGGPSCRPSLKRTTCRTGPAPSCGSGATRLLRHQPHRAVLSELGVGCINFLGGGGGAGGAAAAASACGSLGAAGGCSRCSGSVSGSGGGSGAVVGTASGCGSGGGGSRPSGISSSASCATSSCRAMRGSAESLIFCQLELKE